jgi:hypothetical protein
MPQRGPRKKSAVQLDREIAEALHGPQKRPPARLARNSYPLRQPQRSTNKAPGHATAKKKRNVKQADILLVANDAALSSQFDRAEQLLNKQSNQRAIATAFTTVTPESAAAGDYASRGWEDQEGDAIEVDATDFEEALETGSHAPVTEAIVKKAVMWLRDHGANEASSSSFHSGVWYETEFVVDYGQVEEEEKQEEFFLRNFTEDEERRIFKEFHSDRRR